MRVTLMLNNSELPRMPLYHMTPKQVADRLIAERMIVGDNAKELQKSAIQRNADARRKSEDLRNSFDIENNYK
jgi:hypothetical protein